MNIKKNDQVIVLSGKDKGKKGKVLETMPKTGKVIVEGVNVATIHKEIPMYACKVMRVCPKCGKPTRPAYKLADGKKDRVCKKCGEII